MDLSPAQIVIADLKNSYDSNRLQFEMNVNVHLSGQNKKQLRSEVLKEIGIEVKPSKATIPLVSDKLKAYYEQYSLFS